MSRPYRPQRLPALEPLTLTDSQQIVERRTEGWVEHEQQRTSR